MNSAFEQGENVAGSQGLPNSEIAAPRQIGARKDREVIEQRYKDGSAAHLCNLDQHYLKGARPYPR